MIQSVVRQSLSGTQSLGEAREALTARLHSLANANALLTQTDWYGATLEDVIARELATFVARASIDGPPIRLTPNATQGFALVIHELCECRQVRRAFYPGWQNEILWSVDEAGDEPRLCFAGRNEVVRRRLRPSAWVSAPAAQQRHQRQRRYATHQYPPEGMRYARNPLSSVTAKAGGKEQTRSMKANGVAKDFLSSV